MIEPLMKIIRKNVTRGVTALPPQKSHSKIYERRGEEGQENDEGHIVRGE
jgi:hypothetical protein